MGKFEDRLWRELVGRHGPDLAQIARPAATRQRRTRPRVVAGTSLALAGAVAAVALVLGAASSSPAFAVSRNADGSVTVSLKAITAIDGANAKLAALGIRARLVEVTTGCAVRALPPAAVHAIQLTQRMAPRGAAQLAITRLDPGKIPPGKWQVIPTYRAAGTVHIEKSHLMQGQAPRCFSTLVAPPCQVRPMTVLRDRHLSELPPGEAKRTAAQVLAAVRAAVAEQRHPSRRGESAISGSPGAAPNDGTSVAVQGPAPAEVWAVGCYVRTAGRAGVRP